MERFVALLPGIPYIGGKENRLTENLYLTAAMLAFHQELGTHGKTITETARIIYLGTNSLYRSFPYNFMLRWEGWRIFSQDHLNKIRQEAEISHARRYPGDWVFDYLPSDGKTYLYGVNYTECGIVKYLDQQGASELAPYLCWLDYPMCNAMHVGLIRTETIAQGFTKCNFRFCKWQSGAQVTPDFLKN